MTAKIDVSSINKPALAEGMTPIKWNGSGWVNTTSSDTTWYNYENKQWANAKTADGSFGHGYQDMNIRYQTHIQVQQKKY